MTSKSQQAKVDLSKFEDDELIKVHKKFSTKKLKKNKIINPPPKKENEQPPPSKVKEPENPPVVEEEKKPGLSRTREYCKKYGPY